RCSSPCVVPILTCSGVVPSGVAVVGGCCGPGVPRADTGRPLKGPAGGGSLGLGGLRRLGGCRGLGTLRSLGDLGGVGGRRDGAGSLDVLLGRLLGGRGGLVSRLLGGRGGLVGRLGLLGVVLLEQLALPLGHGLLGPLAAGLAL